MQVPDPLAAAEADGWRRGWPVAVALGCLFLLLAPALLARL